MAFSDIAEGGPPPPERELRRPDHPRGWEPGVAWSNEQGTGHVVTEPLAAQPDAALWAEIIADWGLDPDTLEIVDGSIELIGWDSPVKGTTSGERIRLKRYKARLRQRGAAAADRADVEALCKRVASLKPGRVKPVIIEVPRALIVCLSDLQVGKGEGDGSEGTVQRILSALDAVAERVVELRRLGRPVDVVYLLGLGDLVEGCGEHYASQTYTVDLDRTEQERVVRRLVLRAVDVVLKHVERVVVAAVPGNHGENRRDGKAFTNVATDNADLATVETVGEIMAANPDRYGNVSVYLADDYHAALDAHGVIVGFTHGHVTGKKSGHAAHIMEEWWRGQVMGRQGVADADILVSGHRHHLVVSESTGRTFFQCPAMDPGSAWFTAGSGAHSPAGMLTFCVGREAYGERGWGDLAVLS